MKGLRIWLAIGRRVSIAGIAAMAVSALFPAVVPAQVLSGSQQLDALQNLTPEQQRELLDRMSGNQSGGSGDRPGGNTQETANGEVARMRSAGTETRDPVTDVLKPDDVVAVELALPGTMQKGSSLPGGAKDPSAEIAPRRLRQKSAVPLAADEEKSLKNLIALVQARNPYVLDREGALNLPGFPPIRLGGLSEQQAVHLLSVQPALLMLDISLLHLPVAKTGVESLKPYGYDFFERTTSGSAASMPVPAEYVLGGGDKLNVQVFGSQSRTYSLVVNRDGDVSVPDIGPIHVGGQRFAAAKAAIERQVSQRIIGARANVSMGDMRSFQVLVVGEVNQFGTYTVPGSATMLTALNASGGIKPIGSLRNIQLKRQGVVVRRLDLYDILIRGNSSDDARLQPDDVILVPPAGPTVSLDGEVKRPAIYELQGDTSANDLLQMAGGLNADADPARASITRVDEQSRRVILDLDFRSTTAAAQKLRNGDEIRVARLRPQLDSGVMLEGFLHRPGPVAWHPGLRLSDVIGSIDELKPNADAHYVLIRREVGVDRRIQVRSADLIAALSARGGEADLEMQPRDRITVFDSATKRDQIIGSLMDEIRLQSGFTRPTEVVRIDGRVKVAGTYPLEPGMRISDLLRAGGSLDAAAFGGQAELARYELDSNGTRQTVLIDVDLAAVLRGDRQADVLLQAFDLLMIKETPEWTDQESMTIMGEVRFPGTYQILHGETLHDVLERAGGLTMRAFPKGSAFTRVDLRETEQKQLDLLSERMQTDLAALALQAASANQGEASQSLASSQSWLANLKHSRAVGRLVIDLPGLLAEGKNSSKDVLLRDGDVLVVPQLKQEVTVIGEVQTSTSHLYNPKLRRDDYISMSGGTTRKADKGKTYVVRADGSVVEQTGGLLRRKFDVAIQPGDTIVVPLDTERMPRLPFWQAVTQIIYNLAVSVAAVNSF